MRVNAVRMSFPRTRPFGLQSSHQLITQCAARSCSSCFQPCSWRRNVISAPMLAMTGVSAPTVARAPLVGRGTTSVRMAVRDHNFRTVSTALTAVTAENDRHHIHPTFRQAPHHLRATRLHLLYRHRRRPDSSSFTLHTFLAVWRCWCWSAYSTRGAGR